MSINSKMTALADEIRELSGTSGALGLDAMTNKISEANEEIVNQSESLASALAALEGKVAGSASPVLQEKTVTPITSEQSVTPDSGYDGLSKVTVNAIPSNYVKPMGIIGITSNGSYNVTNYATAIVSVGGGGLPTIIPTISTGFVNSTAEGSVIYTYEFNGAPTTIMSSLVYMAGPNKYRHPFDERLIANTPIIVLTSGTITMPTTEGYICNQIASGTGYAVYKYVEDTDEDLGSGDEVLPDI